MISLSYSRISLNDIAQKLSLDSADDAEFIVSKVSFYFLLVSLTPKLFSLVFVVIASFNAESLQNRWYKQLHPTNLHKHRTVLKMIILSLSKPYKHVWQ